MWSLGRIIKNRNSTTLSLSHLHTSAPSSPPQHHTRTRRDPNTARYDDLIAEAGKALDFPRLRHLLIERINNKSYNSRDTFNFITKTKSSISILNKLFNCLANLPKGPGRRSAFESFVKRLCIIGLVDNALQVLDEMRVRELDLNSYIYHPVILALGKKGDVEKAVTVVQGMKKNGIGLDSTTFNNLLMMYCMRRDTVRAVEVLEMLMKEEGVRGDSTTYDAMVIGVCRAGKVEGAITILRAALDDGAAVMDSTYENVIKALLEAGFYEQGMKFVLCFTGRNKRVDDENFNALGVGLIELGRFEEAKMVVEEMKKRELCMRRKIDEFCHLQGTK